MVEGGAQDLDIDNIEEQPGLGAIRRRIGARDEESHPARVCDELLLRALTFCPDAQEWEQPARLDRTHIAAVKADYNSEGVDAAVQRIIGEFILLFTDAYNRGLDTDIEMNIFAAGFVNRETDDEELRRIVLSGCKRGESVLFENLRPLFEDLLGRFSKEIIVRDLLKKYDEKEGIQLDAQEQHRELNTVIKTVRGWVDRLRTDAAMNVGNDIKGIRDLDLSGVPLSDLVDTLASLTRYAIASYADLREHVKGSNREAENLHRENGSLRTSRTGWRLAALAAALAVPTAFCAGTFAGGTANHLISDQDAVLDLPGSSEGETK
ncbi:hypothetical protein HOD30_03220 [Candidatus Peregrinibacteria bacterium]|jgi:hypothetical protein|nr:hypothetical protein [Candidatus Peregrinibacteria bacterium]MBT4631682.1 hypothetical protein [Candidatus Peregrinibacteria bacterium]MBT5517111.1 hypothetical protein [Candidatus Peregrinibacteria bacterium]MBT5823908.1 hypothetical protein [Candidatus Peregrinibacteria bacterium]